MTKAVLGIFDRNKNIDFIVNELKTEGFNPNDISIIMRNRLEEIEFVSDRVANITEGILSGAGAGGVLGGLAGLIISLILPDLGAFLIGVPVAELIGIQGIASSVVSGAITGVAIGGILGAIMGYMVSEGDAGLYGEQIKKGSFFLAVPVEDVEEEKVQKLLEQNGASAIKTGDAEYLGGEKKLPVDEAYRWYPNHERPPFAVIGAKGGKSKGEGKIERKVSSHFAEASRDKKVSEGEDD